MPSLVLSGSYEELNTKIFKSLVRKDMIVVDIGANVGYYTLLFSKLVGKTGKVFAFEPEPHNFSLLMENIFLVNNFLNVYPVNKAVGHSTDKALLFPTYYRGATHTLYSTGKCNEGIFVQVTKLDDFFKETSVTVDIIKIDIDGAEPFALLGMRDVLTRNRRIKILTEFSPPHLKKAGSSAIKYWDILLSLEFNYLYLIDEKHNAVYLTTLDKVMKYCKNNLFRRDLAASLLCSKTPMKEMKLN